MSIVLKIFVISGLYGFWQIIQEIVEPIVKNNLAMEQMNNTVTSNSWIQAYNLISDNSWWLFVIFVLLVFSNEIEQVIYNLKEKNNEEN